MVRGLKSQVWRACRRSASAGDQSSWLGRSERGVHGDVLSGVADFSRDRLMCRYRAGWPTLLGPSICAVSGGCSPLETGEVTAGPRRSRRAVESGATGRSGRCRSRPLRSTAPTAVLEHRPSGVRPELGDVNLLSMCPSSSRPIQGASIHESATEHFDSIPGG